MLRTVWKSSSSEEDLLLTAGSKSDASFFQDILAVRTEVSTCWSDNTWPTQEYSFDEYSDHYCLYAGEKPVASLAVTRLLAGPFDPFSQYPQALMEEFRDCVASSSRLRIILSYQWKLISEVNRVISVHMLRKAWREHNRAGVTLDLINVEKHKSSYYRRLGYLVCPDCTYFDPVLKTECEVMFLAADPDRRSVVQDVFQDSNLTLSAAEVLRVLNRESIYYQWQAM